MTKYCEYLQRKLLHSNAHQSTNDGTHSQGWNEETTGYFDTEK